MTRWRVHGESTLYASDWLDLNLAHVELRRGNTFSHHVDDVRSLIATGEIPDGLTVKALGLAFALGRL